MYFYIRFWGKRACFTHPAIRTDRYSYSVPPRTAIIGMLESIYWKPEIKWDVKSVIICSPVKREVVTTNECRQIPNDTPFNTVKYRAQRMNNILHNPDYIVKARIITKDNKKHEAMFLRRASKGQYYHPVFLGLKEYTANYELLESIKKIKIPDDLKGKTVYDALPYQFNGKEFEFRPAVLDDGVLFYGKE